MFSWLLYIRFLTCNHYLMLPPKCTQIVKKKKKLNILCFEKRIIQELSVEVFASMVI